MPAITVHHIQGDRFGVSVRNHVIGVDQPLADGGDDTGPTPTKLFVSGLVACVAHYARRYLSRHGLPTEGLEVSGDFAFARHPSRVADITIEVTVPDGVPADRREALLAVASHCTVHNSLELPPAVSVTLVEQGLKQREPSEAA